MEGLNWGGNGLTQRHIQREGHCCGLLPLLGSGRKVEGCPAEEGCGQGHGHGEGEGHGAKTDLKKMPKLRSGVFRLHFQT